MPVPVSLTAMRSAVVKENLKLILGILVFGYYCLEFQVQSILFLFLFYSFFSFLCDFHDSIVAQCAVLAIFFLPLVHLYFYFCCLQRCLPLSAMAITLLKVCFYYSLFT